MHTPSSVFSAGLRTDTSCPNCLTSLHSAARRLFRLRKGYDRTPTLPNTAFPPFTPSRDERGLVELSQPTAIPRLRFHPSSLEQRLQEAGGNSGKQELVSG